MATGRGSATTARRLAGARGEALAAEWYLQSGYVVLARNWRCRDGEIDLVCRKGSTLVVCEVKSRSSDAFGTPVDALTPAKRERLRRLAARYLREDGVRYREVRFDVAAVRGESVQVVPAAW